MGYIVIDGLDECESDQRAEVQYFLQNLASAMDLKVIIFTRPDILLFPRPLDHRIPLVQSLNFSDHEHENEMKDYIA
jgi:hypothetical protein